MNSTHVDSPPLVSVVVPTFNHAPLLRNAIESIRSQTYSQWQAIIVNNYSTDDTADIVNEFNDDRIFLHNFHNNGIIAASRNIGISHSTGDYVAFLDSDDVWYPEKLEECVSVLENGNDLVCHGELWVSETRSSRKVMYGPKSRASYRQLLFRGNCISTSATVVRRSLLVDLKGFSERADFVTAEDYDLWLRIAKVTQRIEFVPKVLGEFRRHGANASNDVLRNMLAELAVIGDHFAGQNASPSSRFKQRQRRALAYYGAGRGLDAGGNFGQATSHFARSFLTWPFSLRLYPAILAAFFHLLTPLNLRKTH